MKRLSLLFIIVLLCSFAEKKKTPHHDPEIKGPVKCIRTYTYKSRAGTGLQEWNEVCYDEMGNVCSSRHYEGRNELITKDTTVISYNDDGNIARTLYHLSAYPDTLRSSYKYDRDGILIRKDASWKPGKAPRSEKYLYDKTGNLASILTIEPDGSQSSRTTYTYNGQGLLIKMVKASNIPGGVMEATIAAPSTQGAMLLTMINMATIQK